MPMTDELRKSMFKANDEFYLDFKTDGCVSENNVYLNEANRSVIREMHKAYGDCWVGKINLYGEERTQESPQILFHWSKGDTIDYPSFCIPRFSQELVDLIIARDRTPYDGTKTDAMLVDEIHRLVIKLEGFIFVWSC